MKGTSDIWKSTVFQPKLNLSGFKSFERPATKTPERVNQNLVVKIFARQNLTWTQIKQIIKKMLGYVKEGKQSKMYSIYTNICVFIVN